MRLAVDSKNQLQELRATPGLSAGIRMAAKIISYIFHPLFVPVYLLWFLIIVQPYLFAGISSLEKSLIVPRFFIHYIFLPLVSVLLLKGLGFIQSVYLKTQKERIIPYAICMIYYFWMWYVLHNQPEFPGQLVLLSLSVFIASIAGWLANIYIKISMHAISMGVMTAFTLFLAFSLRLNFGIYISVALLIAGLVCTARFIVSDHSQKEVYGGLMLGFVSQIVANWIG